MPKNFVFKLTASQRKGLRDFWQIYAACHGEIAAELRRMAAKKPEIAAMLQISRGKEGAKGYEMLQSAVLDNAWQPYLVRLKEHGMEYARLGLGFEAWFEIISAYRKLMLPHLLSSYGPQTGGDLARVLDAMEILIDVMRNAVYGGYLATKENIIREQQQTILAGTQRRQVEERFQTLVESAPDAMVIVDEKGKIYLVNSQTEKLFGYARAELCGQTLELLIPERFRKRHLRHRVGYLSNPQTREMGAGLGLFGLRKDGSEFPAEISLSPLRTEQGLLVTAAIRDISERRLAEESLRRQMDLHEAMLNAQSDLDEGFLIIDGDRIVHTNQAFCRISGYTEEEILALPAYHALFPADEVATAKERQRRRKRGEELSDHYETRIIHKGGYAIDLEVAVKVLSASDPRRVATIVRDITARKRAEEALQTSEQRFRALVEGGADEILVLNANLQPLYMSPSVARASGFSKEEVELREPFSAIHPDEKPVVEKMVREFAKNPGKIQEYQIRLRNKDGSWRWVEGTARNLIADPSVRGYVLNYRDVSERKQHMRELVAITGVSTALRRASTRSEMFPVIVDQVIDLLEVDAGGIAMRDPVSGDTIIELSRGIPNNEAGLHVPPGQGLNGHVIQSGQAYLSNNIAADSIFRAPEQLVELKAMACIPLVAEGETIGALWIGRKSTIETSEVRLLSSIGSIAANAIHRATLQEQTEQHLRHIAALHAIDVAISSSFDLEFVLNVMLEQVINQLSVDAADILLLDSHLNILEYGAGRGFRTRAIQHSKLRLGEGQAGHAALERRTVHIDDFSAAPDQGFTRPDLVAMEAFISYYGVPLISKGEVRGVLEIFHRKPLKPDPEWLEFLDTLAGQAAIAIADATLFNDLQRSNSELTIAYDATIEGWSHALDLRDRETEGHTQRVTAMTLRLARAMGLSDAELVHIRRGALLHDIGKMGIPDNILLKSDALTGEEWATMRKHPVYAFEMLSPIQFLRRALDIPYCHHEKWDGSGYPRGLKEDEIPLAARIFAVVDIWDALRSDRPYRAAWPEERVKEYLYSLSGNHLDPQVVTAFMKMIGNS